MITFIAPTVRPDLSDPIWTIKHVAAALDLEVDTAREYTYDPDLASGLLPGHPQPL